MANFLSSVNVNRTFNDSSDNASTGFYLVRISGSDQYYDLVTSLGGLGGDDTLTAISPDGYDSGGGYLFFNGSKVGYSGSTLYGDQGNDTLRGGDANDFLYGGDGNDILTGGAGNDRLEAGLGDDSLTGGAGNDTLIEYDGNSLLDGGDGDDNLTLNNATGTMRGGAGNDTFSVTNASANGVILDGGADNDTLFGGGDLSTSTITGIEHLRIASATMTAAQLNAFSDVGLGGVSNFTLTLASSGTVGGNFLANSSGTIITTAGSDTITLGSSTGQWTIYGGAGIDQITTGSGNDFLYGGDGNDILTGGAGNDRLEGGDGLDFASYAEASAGITVSFIDASTNTGEAAGDIHVSIEGLIGSSFGDSLTGNASANTLIGGAGNDVLHGGEGSDSLSGGAGADVLDGGAGFDFASYADAASGIVVRLDFAAGLFGEANGDSYTFSGGLLTTEGVIGSSFNDTIIGDGAANGIYGGGGNDVILGLGGSDGIFGDFGNDTLFGGRGIDYLVGGNGAPVPAGQTDNDVFAFVSADTEAGVYDTIIDFHKGEDAILLQGFGYTDAAQPTLIDVDYGAGLSAAVISYGGGTAGVTIVGITSAQLQGAAAPGGDWYLY